jgi:hypothetical protein
MLLGGAHATLAFPINECVVPDVNGPVAIWLTSDGQPLINNVRDRSTAQLVAGPTFAFIDTKPEVLGSLARVGADVPVVQESSSTRTISPEEASSIIDGIGIATAGADSTDIASATDSAALTQATDFSATDSAATDSAATQTSATDSAAATSTDVAESANLEAAAPVPGSPGGPNPFTGLSGDGSVTVNGWTIV